MSDNQRDPSTKLRLFIALAIPEQIVLELEKLQNEFRVLAPDISWVRIHNAHITLKFLGYVPPEKVKTIEQALNAVETGAPSVEINVQNLGFFPTARRPAVFWAGLESAGLQALQLSVETVTAQLGFEKEKRAFHPHVTLARIKDSRKRLPLIRDAEARKDQFFGNFQATEFHLYQSILSSKGAIYRERASYRIR